MAVSAVAPAVLGAVVHLAVLTAQSRTARAELDGEALGDPAEGADTGPGEGEDAPEVVTPGDAAPVDNSIERSQGVHNGVDNNSAYRAAELIAAGVGRRRLAAELGVSEHQARQLLAERNGAVR